MIQRRTRMRDLIERNCSLSTGLTCSSACSPSGPGSTGPRDGRSPKAAGPEARSPESPDDARAEAARLHAEGFALPQVGKRFGISDEGVRSVALVSGDTFAREEDAHAPSDAIQVTS
jgi:hypothetical protein